LFKERYMEIVPAQEIHVPQILDLWQEFAKHHEPFDPRYPMKEDVRVGYETHLREAMQTENTKIYVAMDSGRAVGYTIANIRKTIPWQRERYGYIEEMAVNGRYRRQGVGTILFDAVMDWFKMENLDLVELTVASKNMVGYSFWKKKGFQDYLHTLYLKI
jgi:ribosomal protein S18 acetylase RimI-like enzyme